MDINRVKDEHLLHSNVINTKSIRNKLKRQKAQPRNYFKKVEKRVFFYSAICYTLFYTLAIIAIMIVTYAKLKSNSDILLTMRSDWDSYFPVVDIQIFAATSYLYNF